MPRIMAAEISRASSCQPWDNGKLALSFLQMGEFAGVSPTCMVHHRCAVTSFWAAWNEPTYTNISAEYSHSLKASSLRG